MNVFDYIEKELDRIEVGYTSYDGTKITMSMDEVRELVQNLKKKYKADGDVVYRQDAIDAICKACSMEEDYHKCDGYSETRTWCDELVALRALPSAQHDLIAKIQNGINVTNTDDSYSCGMRNGMRWCMSLINDKDPSFEECPSAQPEQTDCEYCHEDSDGYVTPLEKNCHAFVTYSPIDGWILSVKYGAWRKDVSIQYCPMCGRELKNDK